MYARCRSDHNALGLFLVPHLLADHGVDACAHELDELELRDLVPVLQAGGGAIDHIGFEVFLLQSRYSLLS